MTEVDRPVRVNLVADLERMVEIEDMSRWRWRLEVIAHTLVFPKVRAVIYFRVGQVLARKGLLPLAYWLQGRAIRDAGVEISPLADVGPGLMLAHSVGIVIGGDVRLGRNAFIYQGVTLGDGTRPGRPWVGDNVLIGTGAAVLGGVRIGDNVLIGAHAVVTRDLPDNVVATGAPATYRPRTDAEFLEGVATGDR